MLGDRVRAEKAFDAALAALPKDKRYEGGRIDYGSPLRDAAAVVTLAAEGDAPKLILVSATKDIDKARDVVTYTSTQEDAWLVLAARALGKQNVSLTVNDAGQQAWREWMHAPVTASDAGPTMLAKVCLLGRLPAADRRACVRRGAAREDRGGCRSARLVGSGTRCYRGLGRRPAGLPLTAGDPGPRHPRACARNAVAR